MKKYKLKIEISDESGTVIAIKELKEKLKSNDEGIHGLINHINYVLSKILEDLNEDKSIKKIRTD